MNKIRVIDLLNKIANGEIPKTIVYDERYFTYDDKRQNYFAYDDSEIDWKYTIMKYINDEIEIIEDTQEEKKIPEKLECYHQYDECVVKDKFYQDQKGSLVDEIIIDTINKIIDYLKSKGE